MTATLKQLRGRKLDIARGVARGVSHADVLRYREKWADEGYELPTLEKRTRISQNTRLASHHISSLGTRILDLLEDKIGSRIGCSSCRRSVLRLNRLDPSDVLPSDFVSAYREMAGRAPEVEIQRIVDTVVGQEGFGASVAAERTKRRARTRQVAKRHGGMWRDSRTTGFISSEQFQRDIKNLVAKVPSDITAIAGVARSGLSAATMLSMYLHLPMVTIRQTMRDVVPTGNGWRLGGSKHVNPRTDRVLVVDDTVMSGNSFKSLRNLLRTEFGNYTTCAVYVNPNAAVKPDFWAVDLSWPHLLEWNLFNSVLSPNMAVDFDGILCRDCRPDQDDDGPKYLDFIRNAQPLYLPRKAQIPMIVTARIEKYRQPTLEWLHRYGISVKSLVMHPAANLRLRQRDDIARFKAEHVKRWKKIHKVKGPPPIGFIESDVNQARRIAELSGVMTICPAAARVFR